MCLWLEGESDGLQGTGPAGDRGARLRAMGQAAARKGLSAKQRDGNGRDGRGLCGVG